MIVLVSLSYPVKIKKTVDEHIENFCQIPDYLVTEGPCISTGIGVSFRRMCIFEVSDSNLEDAIHYFDEKVKPLEELPGFNYEFKQLSTIDEVLKLKGGL